MYGINIIFEEETSVSDVERVETLLKESGFLPISGGLYVCPGDGLVNGFRVTERLKKESGLTVCIRSMHIFRVEDLSDLTSFVKE